MVITERWSKRVETIAIFDPLGLELRDVSLPPAADHEMGMSEHGSDSPAPQVPMVAASLLVSLQRVPTKIA